MHRVVVAVITLQGRKRRWRNGAKLVETARAHNSTGPSAPPPWLAKRVSISTDDAAGFPVHTLRPLVASPGAKTILYLHGGGFIHDFAKQHWSYMTSLVEGTGATVIAPQYPLAPQHTWRDSYTPLLELGRDVDVVMGDSAGGNMALLIAQGLTEVGIQRDAILISPLIDLTLSSAKTAEYDAVDPWLASDGILHAGAAWAGDDDPQEVSAMFGSFEGLGRVLVFTGTRDTLHPQARQLARRMPSATIVSERDLVHVYPLLPIPEAARALSIVENFLRL